MNILAVSGLFLWLPIVVGFFASRPPRRAVVTSYIFAWLFLPNLAWNLPGIPDYSKMTATVIGVFLSVAVFDMPRLMAFRPRWFDLPMAVFCLCPLVPASTVGMGPYEGAAASVWQLFMWGFPYLIGRIYFNTLEGIRELIIGIVIGGLIYVPLCLFEIRFSPQLQGWVYGMNGWEGERYGGYRPKVFLMNGLELGMWMTCSSLMAQRLWATGSLKTLRGYPFGKLTLALLVTTVLCKSTGALLLLLAGILALWAASKTRSPWPVWALLALAPFYTGTRVSGLWSGRQLVEVARVFGPERAQSLEFRMENEDVLIAHALKHPVFGGGRQTGTVVVNKQGRPTTIIDGYWMIVMGQNGVIGLAALLTMSLLPSVLFIRRFPVQTWTTPEVGPAAAVGVTLILLMIDNMSNAMLNPIFALMIGGLTAVIPTRQLGHLGEVEGLLAAAREMRDGGRLRESVDSFRRSITLASRGDGGPEARRLEAEGLEGLASVALADGRPGEAEQALRESVALREAIAAETPGLDQLRDLASARVGLGRVLAVLGRAPEAIDERGRALELWTTLARRNPGDLELRERWANALNDLAWLLADGPDPALLDPDRAAQLAGQALRIVPELDACWNTLGVALYRLGDHVAAVEALERSTTLGPPGGTAFDHYFLAMAWCRLDDPDRAHDWFDRAVAWSDLHRPGHPDLARYRDEAARLLEGPQHSGVNRT